jgi:hypothetical protein
VRFITGSSEGRLTALRTPGDLMARRPGGPDLPPGTVMFGGTLGAVPDPGERGRHRGRQATTGSTAMS